MNKLLELKECLMSAVEVQLHNLESADYKELGGAIDMIKDLAEAAYYCTVTQAMEDKHNNETNYYYTEYRYPDRDMDRNDGRMYYSDHGGMSSNQPKNYQEKPWNWDTMRDRREGRSPMSRKSYMEAKEMHVDKTTQTQELEKYMTELSADLTEIIESASPEEKIILQKKLTALANRIV